MSIERFDQIFYGIRFETVRASDYDALLKRCERLEAALNEIIAINDESQSAFNKRGTRRGLSIVTARAALRAGDAP